MAYEVDAAFDHDRRRRSNQERKVFALQVIGDAHRQAVMGRHRQILKALDSFRSRLYSIEAIRRAADRQLYPFTLRTKRSR